VDSDQSFDPENVFLWSQES